MRIDLGIIKITINVRWQLYRSRLRDGWWIARERWLFRFAWKHPRAFKTHPNAGIYYIGPLRVMDLEAK